MFDSRDRWTHPTHGPFPARSSHGLQWTLKWWARVYCDGECLWEGPFRGYLASIHRVLRRRALLQGYNPNEVSILLLDPMEATFVRSMLRGSEA